jgi:hypothetical protein
MAKGETAREVKGVKHCTKALNELAMNLVSKI